MSDFRDRLRAIREKAEERVTRLGAARDQESRGETDLQQQMQDSAATVCEAVEELLAKFAEEYQRFEKSRVSLEGELCVRISCLEEIRNKRMLSRLTFSITLLPEPGSLKLTCKGVVFNREKGHEELDCPPLVEEEHLTQVRAFTESCLLQFASDYEEIRVEALGLAT